MVSGVDMIQLREPDLSAHDLFLLTKQVVDLAAQYGCDILVNDRADIAVSCGAGVHLTTRSLRPGVIRRIFGPKLLIGVSTHSLEEVNEAQDGGADFVVFGPVYETEAKKKYGPPVGVGSLESVSSRFEIPVLALGGINEANTREALMAGAAGIAGISIFTNCRNLALLVNRVRQMKSEE
jgi:thiamine-phosphate pyrophosphorylase